MLRGPARMLQELHARRVHAGLRELKVTWKESLPREPTEAADRGGRAFRQHREHVETEERIRIIISDDAFKPCLSTMSFRVFQSLSTYFRVFQSISRFPRIPRPSPSPSTILSKTRPWGPSIALPRQAIQETQQKCVIEDATQAAIPQKYQHCNMNQK